MSNKPMPEPLRQALNRYAAAGGHKSVEEVIALYEARRPRRWPILYWMRDNGPVS